MACTSEPTLQILNYESAHVKHITVLGTICLSLLLGCPRPYFAPIAVS